MMQYIGEMTSGHYERCFPSQRHTVLAAQARGYHLLAKSNANWAFLFSNLQYGIDPD